MQIKTGKNKIDNIIYKDENAAQQYDMIVFCHLRWEFVYQRPQHLVSRMAKYLKILFIEEPIAFGPEEKQHSIIATHHRKFAHLTA